MRKKVFSGVFALALLATAGWGVNKSLSNDAGLSDLALSNVEALAQNEDDYPEFWENCAGSWNATKCVCGSRAFTYAEAVQSACSTESM